MTRAATAPELVKLASDGQLSSVYGIVSNPTAIFAARVNQATITADKLTNLTFDGVTTGAYTAIKPGMTVLIGSAAGLSDHGVGFARKSATSTMLFLGETSEILAADNDYITVLPDFAVWHKKPRMAADGTFWVNTDEAYTDQLSVIKPTIYAGGDRVLLLTGASVSTTYALSGAASYVTTCSGGTVTNGTTSTPSIAFTTAGEYLVTIVATGANSKVSTTYRTVFVYTAASAPRNIILRDNPGDDAGWSATMEMYESTTTIRDRAKVVIFAADSYGGTAGSIGSLAGCENVITTGWIVGKTIVYDDIKGSVSFKIQPAAWWLDNETNEFEIPLIASSTSANWHHMPSVTADLAVWNLLENYSTVLNCCDYIPTGDTRTAPKLVAPIGSVWSQVMSILDQLPAYATCNQYGQIITGIDTPLVPIADRAGIPVVVTLTADDFESIEVDAVQIQPTAQYIIIGILPSGQSICGIGGGRVPDRVGNVETPPSFMAATQDQLNVLAGSLFARDNTPYKFSIRNLRGNNRLIEPFNRIGITIVAADNLAGIAYSGYAIVRNVTRSHNPDTGAWAIDLEADAETQATRYTTGNIPVITDDGDPDFPTDFPTDIPFPRFPPFNFPPSFPPSPPPDPPVAADCLDTSPYTGPYTLAWDTTYLDGGDTTKLVAKAYKRCTIRAATADNPTVLTFHIAYQGKPYEHLSCYGIDGADDRIVTGAVTYTLETVNYAQIDVAFSEAGPVTVAGFELVMEAGYDPGADPAALYSSSYGLYNPSGGETSNTCARTAYDSASGYMRLDFAATGTAGAVLGIDWILYADLTSDVGATGQTWAFINWQSTGPYAMKLDDANTLKIIAYANFAGFYQFSKGPNIRADDDLGFSSGSFHPGSYEISGYVEYFFCGTRPARWAGLEYGLLYNICPAVVT